jgi:rhamnose utilization protein RhaD (predicted bifunctional aldolase and dehydrogenase)
LLSELARLSQTAGARPDYVQGGGGNTSVKLGNGLMAIKASGRRLSQVTGTDGFAVVEVDTLKDVTAEQGYKPLRPSVEVGFHALLGKYVLHTHPVYVNLALCSVNGADRLPEWMAGIPYITVPYFNPGAELCAAVKEKLQPETQVVFMVNHGLVVSADSADECLRLHDKVNRRIAKAYGVTRGDFDAFAKDAAKPLYPDQQVYLEMTDTQREIMTAVMFIRFTLMKRGETVQVMDESKALSGTAVWDEYSKRKDVPARLA